MQIPPVTVYLTNTHVQEMLEHYLGVPCVEKITPDEQCVYVTFKPTMLTDTIQNFINKLGTDVNIVYNNRNYRVCTQYFN